MRRDKKLKRKVVKLSEVYAAKPITFDDIQTIISVLMEGNPLTVNFDQVGFDATQRFIDYLSGALFALQGSIRQLSELIFLLVPNNVTVVSPA